MGFYVERLLPMVKKTVELEAETPHLRGIVDGTLPLEKFKFQVRQNYNYLIEYAKAWAIGMAKCSDFETMSFWYEIVKETVEHEIPFYREHWKTKLGISFEEMDGTVMNNTKRSYTSHELARSWEGDLAEQVTSLLPCDVVYWEMGKYLAARCKLPAGHLYRDWIEFYTRGWFTEATQKLVALIDKLVAHKTPRELAKIEEIFAVGCNYEYLTWHSYYAMETWPIGEIFPAKFTTIQE